MPGARPMIANAALGSPNDGTGELNHSGSRARASARNPASLGQSGQLRAGSVRRGGAGGPRLGSLSLGEIVVIGPRRHGGRALQELRRVMTRFARGRALGGIAA